MVPAAIAGHEPDDELEVLILHYHDLWMWETGDKKHREKFEELLAERDLRAEKGFVIQRPSFSEAKKMYRGEPKTGISLRHKLRQREKLTPLTMPGMSRVLDAKSAYAWMGVPRRSSTTGKLDMWLRLDPKPKILLQRSSRPKIVYHQNQPSDPAL